MLPWQCRSENGYTRLLVQEWKDRNRLRYFCDALGKLAAYSEHRDRGIKPKVQHALVRPVWNHPMLATHSNL